MPFLSSLLHLGAKASKASARLAIPAAVLVVVSLAGVAIGPAVVSALRPSRTGQANKQQRPDNSNETTNQKKLQQRSKRGIKPVQSPIKRTITLDDKKLRPATQLFGGAALTCKLYAPSEVYSCIYAQVQLESSF